MILGMTPFTLFHVLLSLIGIATGLVVLRGLLANERMDGLTSIFLATTAATTITGFLFPFSGFTPAIGVGIVSTVVLAAAIAARYVYGMRGTWRGVYVVGAVVGLYLNCFVLVVQAFLKIGPLNALAPNGSEPPFAIAQAVVLLFFLWAGFVALRRFRPAGSPMAVR